MRLGKPLYDTSSSILTGPLQPTADKVTYLRVMTRKQTAITLGIGILHLLLIALLAVFLLLPDNLPHLLPDNELYNISVVIGLGAMLILQVIAALRTWAMLWFSLHMHDPIPMQPQPGLRVAVLT